MSRCTCDTYQLTGLDTPVVVERQRDPDCREHGYPNDEWPANSPLYKFARYVDRQTGEVLQQREANERCESFFETRGVRHVDGVEFMRRFRLETPREVEARLLVELGTRARPPAAHYPLPIRRCPAREAMSQR